MKKQILKIAGVKSEKEFYKKFPTEEAFMAKHGKELKKAQIGTYMTSEAPSDMYQPADVRGMYDELDYQLTGMTAADRAKMQAIQQIAAQSSQSGGGGGMDMSQIAQMAGAAKKGKKITKAQAGENMIGYPTGPQLTPSAQNLQQQQYNWGTNTATSATTKNKFNLTKAIPVIGQVIGGIQSIKAQKEAYRAAKQQTALTDVMSQAAASRPVQQPRRQYVRPEDMAFQPEQMFPSYGVGTNVLAEFGASVGGGEIANTYAPGTLYDNLGYEPLNDSERYKQFYHGGKMHKAADGFMSKFNSSQVGQVLGSPEAQQLANFSPTGGYSQVLGGVGGLLGGPIGTMATFVGSAIDREKQKMIENQQELSRQNINKIVGQNFGMGIQSQFASYMEDGGILKAQSGKDLTKKDGKCEAEEARNRADRAQGKVDARANAAWDREVAAAERRDVRQNAQQMADYLSEGLTGYGDKIKRKDFEAAYQTFATQNPELAKDRLLYTLANKELNKVRNNPDYLMRNVLRRTDPNLDYKALTLPQLMQTMQKGYGSGQGYYDAWKEGFPMRQSAIQQVVPIQQENGGQTSPYKWVSHTWQPQVIASFGGHNLKDLLKPPHDADMLRAGGHLKAYTPPSAEAMSTERPMMQMGGELETHWGGYAEPMSYNPYLPDGGETVMFRGQSHDESDGRGNTGIGITYGENPVEVERGEPAVKLQDGSGGDSSLVVFGNLKIPKSYLPFLGEDAEGKKFKTYVADLSKKENNQNKKLDKATQMLEDFEVSSPIDKMTLNSLQYTMLGANQKLKELADKKISAASLQNAINDTAEEYGLIADDLAKGKVKIDKKAAKEAAKFGKEIEKAQFGFFGPIMAPMFGVSKATQKVAPAMKMMLPSGGSGPFGIPISVPSLPQATTAQMASNSAPTRTPLAFNPVAPVQPLSTYSSAVDEEEEVPAGPIATAAAITRPVIANNTIPDYPVATTDEEKVNQIMDLYEKAKAANAKNPGKKNPYILELQKRYHTYFPEVAEKIILGAGDVTARAKSKGIKSIDELRKRSKEEILDTNLDEYFGPRTEQYIANLPKKTPPTISSGELKVDKKTVTTTDDKTTIPPTAVSVTPYKRNPLLDVIGQVLPYLRPTDTEELDPRQLIGEMYALANNQLEAVQAQTLQPQLSVPYDISYQDILNENEATFRSQQRMLGYNPAAQSQLNAQKYQANQKVLAEQFRANQAMKDAVYRENRNLLNEFGLKNLEILDRQYVRQETAKSKTKATTQLALNSIGDKFMRNQLSNRKLATAENLYNFRYDPRFRTINMNAPFQPQIPTVYVGPDGKQYQVMAPGTTGAPNAQIPSMATPPIVPQGSVPAAAPSAPAVQPLAPITEEELDNQMLTADEIEEQYKRGGRKGISVSKKKSLNSSVVKAFKNL